MFGENFTVSGLLETEVCVGDIWRVGEAVIQVTMPRAPCFKFGHKLGRTDILKQFLHSGRCGYYHRVVEEGVVCAGDRIEILEKEPRGITMREMLGMYQLGEGDRKSIQGALEIDCLSPMLRKAMEQRLGAGEE